MRLEVDGKDYEWDVFDDVKKAIDSEFKSGWNGLKFGFRDMSDDATDKMEVRFIISKWDEKRSYFIEYPDVFSDKTIIVTGDGIKYPKKFTDIHDLVLWMSDDVETNMY